MTLMCSCEDFRMDYTYEITLINNSNDTIYSLCIEGNMYRFQSVDTLDKDSSIYEIAYIPANRKDFFVGISDIDPKKFPRRTDTITVFILDKKEYESKSWAQLTDSAHFKQIYHLSGDDIRKLDSDVPYPPTEAMRNIDMVPSYDETMKN